MSRALEHGSNGAPFCGFYWPHGAPFCGLHLTITQKGGSFFLKFGSTDFQIIHKYNIAVCLDYSMHNPSDVCIITIIIHRISYWLAEIIVEFGSHAFYYYTRGVSFRGVA